MPVNGGGAKPQSYGVVQQGMAGASPEQVKAAMEKVMYWAGVGASIFGPYRGAIVKFLTPILTSDEFCGLVSKVLARTKPGDKVSFNDLVNA